jgi:hypothetical protein
MNRDNDRLRGEIDRNESRAHWGAWAVVAGLVAEAVMAVKFPAGQTVLENWAPVVADSLIAAGVYAEIHFSGKASRAHRELQSHTDAKLAIAIKEAAEANQKAAEANERTAALQIALEEERSKRRSRTITQEQFDLLQKLRGKLENIEVRWDVRDIETSFFAGLLMTALRHAGIGLRVRPPFELRV